MEHIYLDHAATTPVHPQVLKRMCEVEKETFGNPSSVHAFGRKARQLVDSARSHIAKRMGANEKEIIFTSGGTEADNLALVGVARANRDKGNHIIVTAQEHHAVLHTAEALEKEGFRVTYVPVDRQGKIAVEDVMDALTSETILVSVMYVNNETGIIQPIQEIAEQMQHHQAYLHTDAVQAFGLLAIDVRELGVDLLTVSAHKINGPKGIGLLYTNKDVQLQSLQYGGEQERKRRAGTEDVARIVGFEKAVELAVEHRIERVEQYQALKQQFINGLQEQDIAFQINGDEQNTVASIVNISFPNTAVEALLTNLDLDGVAASSGSACTAGSVEPSHVLTAMYGSGDEHTTNSVRFSFGLANTPENIQTATKRVAKSVTRLTQSIR
ncbi:cysteine desulfurase family protein [Virgibacillus chiguensis]|uniref:cysteine desulfurase n=1 Tax=Virgibacillus chiguensis TaxID=411959 RepID=A0A1M5M4N9_9BACI|nr:cysteine desulfurase family protein [Virgibacillus chiguensis]SHG72218.1 cysteine desulfurase [Virgibacillus chiguensis]